MASGGLVTALNAPIVQIGVPAERVVEIALAAQSGGSARTAKTVTDHVP